MRRVLIVDDAKNIRMLLSKCLEAEGYQVATAANGREGLELLLSQSFDLVFLDVKLPELSGTEVLRRIRARGDMTPVIIITAYPTVKNAVECTKLQSITYLQKPFTADRLRNVLREFSLQDGGDPATAARDEVGALLEEGRYSEAVSRLKAVLAEDPTDPETYFALERAYLGLGDPDTAQRFHRAGTSFQA